MSSEHARLPIHAAARGIRRPSSHRAPALSPFRLIFLSTMATTLAASSIVGGALAWRNTVETDIFTVGVGEVEAVVSYTPNGNPVGPNDGEYRTVGAGDIQNVGTLNMRYKDSKIVLTSVTNGPDCNLTMFAGRVLTYPWIRNTLAPGASTAGQAYDVQIAALPLATSACDGATVSFSTTWTFQAMGG